MSKPTEWITQRESPNISDVLIITIMYQSVQMYHPEMLIRRELEQGRRGSVRGNSVPPLNFTLNLKQLPEKKAVG